jgi:hypothetical protein
VRCCGSPSEEVCRGSGAVTPRNRNISPSFYLQQETSQCKQFGIYETQGLPPPKMASAPSVYAGPALDHGAGRGGAGTRSYKLRMVVYCEWKLHSYKDSSRTDMRTKDALCTY